MTLDKIASIIYSDLYGGTTGFNANPAISMEMIEDECVEKRQVVIKELFAKDLLKPGDLAVTLNCVNVDCQNMIKCDSCTAEPLAKKMQSHFEIPQLLTEVGDDAIIYIGSADGVHPFKVYYSMEGMKSNQYRRRGSQEAFVYVDRVPNAKQMCDCWIFNAPFVKQIKVTAVFKDLRQLEQYTCCRDFEYLDFGIISDEVKNRVKQDKFTFYRQNPHQPHLTDSIAR